jgi:CO/xanthine dehydrogenase Mo-binding subunit
VAVEIAVNLNTGEVSVERVANVLDMGTPINPKICEQHIEGGIGTGIGMALYEASKFKDGRLLNADLVNCKIHTANEIPMNRDVAPLIAPVPIEEEPYGAKGFSEMVMAPVAGAAGNALCNATGVRVLDLPFSRERMFAAIRTGRKRE